MRADHGFSLMEMLVALLLTMVVAGAMYGLVNQTAAIAQVQPEVVDMQQRARVAADVMFHDLAMTGSGLSAGPSAGPLVEHFAPVVPRRIGLESADLASVARADAISLVRILGTPTQTIVGAPFSSAAAGLRVVTRPNCAVGRPLCGLVPGMSVVLFEASGRFDLFGVTSVSSDAARVQLQGQTQSGSYETGANIAESETHTYYFDAANNQLRHYDGLVTDVPVIDNVVSLKFEYFGDPNPPLLPKPAIGVGNCLYDAAGGAQPLATLTAEGGSLAPLPLEMLRDGPWCGAGSTAFDADLLRIRRVRVTLRVQATPAAFRASGSGFARPGVSRSSMRNLPDYVVTFDVSPRNLNLAR